MTIFLFRASYFISYKGDYASRLLGLFYVRNHSFFFQLSLMNFTVVLGTYIYELFRVILLRTFRVLRDLYRLILVFVDDVHYRYVFFLLVGDGRPFMPILFLSRLFNSTVQLMSRTNFFYNGTLFSIISYVGDGGVYLRFLYGGLFYFVYDFVKTIGAVRLESQRGVVYGVICAVSVDPYYGSRRSRSRYGSRLFTYFRFFFFLVRRLSPVIVATQCCTY